MKTADTKFDDSDYPMLHITAVGPNRHGMYSVERAWSGLSFAGCVLLGPEIAAVCLSQVELDTLQAELKSGGLPYVLHTSSDDPTPHLK